MHTINLIPLYTKSGRKVIPYMQWTEMYLQTLNRDVLALAEYINTFQTPWIKYTSQSILEEGWYQKWYDKDNKELNNRDDIYVLDKNDELVEPHDNVVRLMLHNLTFREYVINEDINNFVVFNSKQLFDSSIIGYYVSLCQTTPIDSTVMRYNYGMPEQYLAIPFSNGSYYSLVNPYTNQAGSKFFTWKYVEEAIDILGYSNIFNFHSWPCRFIFERELTPAMGATTFNWTNHYQMLIADVTKILWTTKEETVFHEFFFGNEELIMDEEWEVQQTKLLNTTQLRYNIMMKNESPENDGTRKVVWEVY